MWQMNYKHPEYIPGPLQCVQFQVGSDDNVHFAGCSCKTCLLTWSCPERTCMQAKEIHRHTSTNIQGRTQDLQRGGRVSKLRENWLIWPQNRLNLHDLVVKRGGGDGDESAHIWIHPWYLWDPSDITINLKSFEWIWFATEQFYTLHSKITMAGNVVPYYTVTALVSTLK